MEGLLDFMASMNGRIARGVAGIILIALGLFVMSGTAGTIVAIIGLAPLAAGVFDFCLLAPLMGKPLAGAAFRKQNKR